MKTSEQPKCNACGRTGVELRESRVAGITDMVCVDSKSCIATFSDTRSVSIEYKRGVMVLTNVPNIEVLKLKLRQFKALHEVDAHVEVEGWFTDAVSNDPVHLNREHPATVRKKTVAVDIGEEGTVYIARDDVKRVKWTLRRP